MQAASVRNTERKTDSHSGSGKWAGELPHSAAHEQEARLESPTKIELQNNRSTWRSDFERGFASHDINQGILQIKHASQNQYFLYHIYSVVC